MITLFYFLAGLLSFAPLKGENNQIKAIVFDFGGVIAQKNGGLLSDFFQRSLAISPTDVRDLLARLKGYAYTGEEEEFWKLYFDSIGRPMPAQWLEEVNEARFQALEEIPGMVHLVKCLQNKGYLTALLTNVRKSQAEIKGRLGYYELFSPALFSYATGFKKPDPRAYKLMLQELNLPAENVLFIDNKTANVEAAQALGFDAILFANAQQLIDCLGQRGIDIQTQLAP